VNGSTGFNYLGQGAVAYFCEYDNERSGFIKAGSFVVVTILIKILHSGVSYSVHKIECGIRIDKIVL
jgi:hypothetical protein